MSKKIVLVRFKETNARVCAAWSTELQRHPYHHNHHHRPYNCKQRTNASIIRSSFPFEVFYPKISRLLKVTKRSVG